PIGRGAGSRNACGLEKRRRLLGQDPADQVLDVGFTALDDRVLFLRAVDLDLRARRQMRVELVDRIGLAFVLRSRFLVRRTVLLLVDRMALRALVLLGER